MDGSTAPAAAPTPDPTVASILKSAEGIALAKVLPVLNNFLTTVQANASITNLVAQGPALVTALQALLPTLAQGEASFLAGQLLIILQNATSAAPVASTTGQQAS